MQIAKKVDFLWIVIGVYLPIHELITKDKTCIPLLERFFAIFASNKWATTHQISASLSNR